MWSRERRFDISMLDKILQGYLKYINHVELRAKSSNLTQFLNLSILLLYSWLLRRGLPSISASSPTISQARLYEAFENPRYEKPENNPRNPLACSEGKFFFPATIGVLLALNRGAAYWLVVVYGGGMGYRANPKGKLPGAG